MTDNTYDAAVIGAGVIGCSVALALAQAGLRVCVVDRGPGVGYGSTSASSAVVRYNYSTWVATATAWEAKHVWQEWQEHLRVHDEAGTARLIRTGGLVLDSPDQDRTAVLSSFDRAGVPYEEWDAPAIRANLPLLDPGRFYPPKRITDPAFWTEPADTLDGYWTADTGFIDDPQLAAHNLMVAAKRRGVTFRFRSTVTGVPRSYDRVAGLRLQDGDRVNAPVVVNAAGPGSATINALAYVPDDFTVHTRPMRQEVHEVRAPEGYNNTVPGPHVADLDLGTYFRGTPSDRLLIGGVEPECDPLQWLDDPDDYDPRPSKSIFDAQVYRVARRIPALAVPNHPRGIAGVYDVTDDWIPIYDRTALAGYYVAIGTSGNQFKNAPIVGSFLAAIIDSCENGRDHDLSPVRIKLPYTGAEIDLSHYSRRRKVQGGRHSNVLG